MAGKTIKLIDKRKNLTVETGAEICLAAEDLGYFGKCIFVGQKIDQFIVVTPPSNFSPLENNLLQANPLMVRYQFEGDIFEFTSKVLEIKYEPLTLLLLQYPVAIEKKNFVLRKGLAALFPLKWKSTTNCKTEL